MEPRNQSEGRLRRTSSARLAPPSGDFYKKIVETAHEGIWVIDVDAKTTYVNERMAKILGYTTEEMIGRDLFDFLDERGRRDATEGLARRRSGLTEVREFIFLHKLGHPVVTHLVTNPLYDENQQYTGALGMVSDITEQRRAERSHFESESRLQSVISTIPELLMVIDRDGRHREVYQGVGGEPLGAPPRERIGRTIHELYPREQAKLMQSVVDEVLETGRICHVDYSLPTPTQEQWFSANVAPLGGFEEPCVLWVARNITQRVRLEQSARRREEQFDTYFNMAPLGLAIIGEDMRLLMMNERLSTIVGKPLDECLGKELGEFLPSDLKPAVPPIVAKVLETGEPSVEVLFKGALAAHSDGPSYMLASHFLMNLPESGKRGIGVVITDVTERIRAEDNQRTLESQLLQAQKMESIGQLAGGVAHDFNNLLLAILSYSELAQRETAAGSPASHCLDKITNAADRAADLTRQLLAFSRRQVIQPTDVDLQALIVNHIDLLRRLIAADVELKYLPDAQDIVVRVDAGQIEQVLMNLCLNARDAMPDGGRIVISTRVETSAVDNGNISMEDPYAVLSVSDNGKGMRREVAERIFEPFFTTKPRGEGTGLGLSTVYGIVKQHNGSIRVESEESVGSEFQIFLPLARSMPTIHRPELEVVSSGGNETILIAEDEDLVRELVAHVLSTAGYEVLSAADGPEAVKKFRNDPGVIDLVITDMVMPTMSGSELRDAIREIRGDARILFTSGYGEEQKGRPGELASSEPFLAKPYAADKLLRVVRKCLDDGLAMEDSA